MFVNGDCCIGAGAIELAGARAPISDSRGTGSTAEFMGHLQLYEASPNFWDSNIANMV